MISLPFLLLLQIKYFIYAKVIKMYRNICCFLFSLLFSYTIHAQEGSGYNIKIALKGIESGTYYLAGNYGYQEYIFDSVAVKKQSPILFKSKEKKLPSGIYILKDIHDNELFKFIVDKSRNFSISTTLNFPYTQATIEGSEENIIFFEYQKMKLPGDDQLMVYLKNLTDVMPNTLLATYIMAEEYRLEIPSFTDEDNETNNTAAEYAYLKEHFFDNINFNDSRILRMPIDYGISLYFMHIINQKADTVIKEIDRFLEKMSKNDEVKHYFLQYFHQMYDNGEPANDAILVHLFDKYCPDGRCQWLPDYASDRLAREVKRKRKTLPGKEVPPLVAYNLEKNQVTTGNISHSNIVLWFWDSDCDDCVELTPKLFELYDIYKDAYDFEVFAVSVTEDFEGWERFVKEHELDWINASYAQGEPNYDFVEYFDIFTTPAIFLINKEHIIIDRQFSIEELLDKLEP